jgi:hypothetical protein
MSNPSNDLHDSSLALEAERLTNSIVVAEAPENKNQ